MSRGALLAVIGCIAAVVASCNDAPIQGASTAPVRCDDSIAAGGGLPGPDGGHLHPESPIPTKYRYLRNPYGYDDPSLAPIGDEIYAANCARCHGAKGYGDGPLAASLCPRPDDLNEANRLHDDPYLYWRIHDGGALTGFETSMPAYGTTLTDDQIWRVITTIRRRFLDF